MDEDFDLEAWSRTRLKWAVQALALPADTQLALFPDFVCKGDELAIDFGEALLVCRQFLSEAEQSALRPLDVKLAAMSRNGSEYVDDLWRDEAVRTSPLWAAVRVLATDVLREFGWPLESPPQAPGDRGETYIPAQR